MITMGYWSTSLVTVVAIISCLNCNYCEGQTNMDIACSTQWNVNEQNFSVEVDWTVHPSIVINNIIHFTITVTQYEYDASKSSPWTSITSYNFDKPRELGKYSYSLSATMAPKKYYDLAVDDSVTPIVIYGEYHISVTYNHNGGSSVHGLCDFPLSPTRPSRLNNIDVTSYDIDALDVASKLLIDIHYLNFIWTIPTNPVANVSSLGYEIWIGVESDGHKYSLTSVTANSEEQYYGSLVNAEEQLLVSTDVEIIEMKLRCFYEVTFSNVTHKIYSNWSITEFLNISNTVVDDQQSSSSASKSSSVIQTSSTQQQQSSSSLQPSLVASKQSSSTTATTQSTSPSAVLGNGASSSSLAVNAASATESDGNTRMVAILSGVLVPIATILILIILLIGIIMCLRRRNRKFQILSHQLETEVSYSADDDNVMFLNNPKSNVHTLSQQEVLETSIEGTVDEWELPTNTVIIHKKLGGGCFGEVFKGEVKGFRNTHLVSYETRNNGQFVAIKILKKNASNQEKNEFLEEIELMKVIAKGHNPHVVNMLGAVTRQEPMCVVTEYLEYGDLHGYLTKQRTSMQESGENIDTSGYVVEMKPEPMVDLVSFAYQIASGMEYLSSLKIIHRDLACRNILVGEGKILKVSDFGLSRNMTYDSAYVKTSNGPLPIRWMAIESIMYHEFTTASDVWSFGITLWEIGTLGAVPYPNIDNSAILRTLQNGNRVDKPSTITKEVYEIMLSCFNDHPGSRPNFSELRKKFDSMLSKDKNPRELYLDLSVNSPGKLSVANSPNSRPSSNVYVDNEVMLFSPGHSKLSPGHSKLSPAVPPPSAVGTDALQHPDNSVANGSSSDEPCYKNITLTVPNIVVPPRITDNNTSHNSVIYD